MDLGDSRKLTRNCLWCGSDRGEVVVERSDRLNRGGRRYSLLRCSTCGLILLDPPLALPEIREAYPVNYEPFICATEDEPSAVVRLMRRYGERRRSNAILKWKRTGKLLDVGAATGIFLASMKQLPGWDVMGIELDASAAAYATQRLGLRMVAEDVLTAVIQPGIFDVITLWDVFEHLPEPNRVIGKLAELCKPGALLVIQMPRLGCWQQRLFGTAWVGWDVPRHLVLFTPSQLSALLQQAGFEILEISSIAGDYPTFLMSLQTLAQDTGAWWLGALAKIVSTLPARILLFPVLALARSLGAGTSMTVMAKRREGSSP